MPNFISKVSLPNDENLYDLKSYTTQGIFHAQVDSTSTSTAFTVTIPELTATEYYDGLTLLLYNGKVTSASGFTINVNGLGAKPSYSNMALGNPVTPTDPTRDTTIFNINYAMLFIYNSTRVSGGCWICYRGYDANTNTIGYQLRTNATSMKTTAKFYRYRLLFTSADGTKWVPANTSTSTNATAKRNTTQTPIDPFGEITWYGTTTVIDANEVVTSAQLWQQYSGSYTAIGYSFNRTGAAATMTANAPIYIKCAPQADGSAIIDADQPYVQTLPSTEDGKIYIFLGRADSATIFELLMNHPVYYYKDGAIRLWTNAAATGSGLPDVTASDNDKVLKVVNGDWTVTNEDEIFKISALAILINNSYSITANKTYAQIVAALNANKLCQVGLTLSGEATPAYNTNYYLFNYSGSADGALNFISFTPDSEHSASSEAQTNISIPQILLTCTTNNNVDNWQIAMRGLAAPGDTYIGSATTPIYWNADHFEPTSLATVASSGSYNDLTNKPTDANGIIPLANGGTGLNAGTADWYSNIVLHPRFVIYYDSIDGGFNIVYLGPLDGINSIGAFVTSEYYKAACREAAIIIADNTYPIGTATVMSTIFDGGSVFELAFLFPDSVSFSGLTVNGLRGTLVYDANDGVYLDPLTVQPSSPKWKLVTDDFESALYGKENVSNKVTSIDSTSDDDQYPSAKCVYDAISAISPGGGAGDDCYYGYCSSSATTPQKVVTISNTGYTIQNHVRLFVYFENPHTYASSSPYLSINSVTYNIRYYDLNGSPVTGLNSINSILNNRRIMEFHFMTLGGNLTAIALPPTLPTLYSPLRTNNSRITNLNTITTSDGAYLRYYVASSNSVATGTPTINGATTSAMVLHMNWDNADTMAGQVALQVGGSSSQGGMAYRRQNGNSGEWHAWKTLIDQDNISSYLPNTLEYTTNKVTSITSSSTDTHYPSAKAVYDTFWPYNSTTFAKMVRAGGMYVCETAANTAAKVVTKQGQVGSGLIINSTNNTTDPANEDTTSVTTYEHGTRISVIFESANTAQDPTLQLSSAQGAIAFPIYVYDKTEQDYFVEYDGEYPLEGLVEFMFIDCDVGQTTFKGWLLLPPVQISSIKIGSTVVTPSATGQVDLTTAINGLIDAKIAAITNADTTSY